MRLGWVFLAMVVVSFSALAEEGGVAPFGLVSVLPALLALMLMLLTRKAVLSLFLSIWAGAWLISGADFHAVWDSMLRLVDTYLLRALVPEDGNTDHVAILLFTLMTAAMMGILSRNGSLRALDSGASNPGKGQIAAAISGVALFFDDYAHTVIGGNLLRSLADRCLVSREKLAYIIDTTAVPLTSVALLTSWVGFQISLIESGVADIDGVDMSGFELLLASLPYSFYSILSLLFMAMVIGMRRDFGPMATAERAARMINTTSETASPQALTGTHPSAWLSVFVLVAGAVAGLLYSSWPSYEMQAGLTDIFGNANPYIAMLWASFAALLTSIVLTLWRTSLQATEVMAAAQKGVAPLIAPLVVLVLSWVLSGVNDMLGTVDYVIVHLSDNLNVHWFPALIFLAAAILSLATGNSWNVLALLIPIGLPLLWSSTQSADMEETERLTLLYVAIAAAFSGAVFGDHCSPFSDSTILTSASTGCDHAAHVATQLPYGLTVAAITLMLGYLPAGYGLPWWAGLALSFPALYVLLRVLGQKDTVE